MVCHGISQPSPSAYSARSNLGSTVSCDITERDSPTLSQTLRGHWVKRARLGTMLRISDTRLTTLRLRVRLGRCFDELHHGVVKGVLSLFWVACGTWNRQKDCMTKGHFQVPRTLTFKLRPIAQPFLWKWVCLHENEKSFPYQKPST